MVDHKMKMAEKGLVTTDVWLPEFQFYELQHFGGKKTRGLPQQ